MELQPINQCKQICIYIELYNTDECLLGWIQLYLRHFL